MSIIFLITSPFIETAADPARDARRSFFLFFGTILRVFLVARSGVLGATSQLADQVRGPFHGQVLVRKERFPFLPIPGICPQGLIHEVAEEGKAAGLARQFSFPKFIEFRKNVTALKEKFQGMNLWNPPSKVTTAILNSWRFSIL